MTADAVFEMFYRQAAEDIPAGRLPPMDQMRRLTEEQNNQFVANSAAAFPEYADLHCAPDGALWLQVFDPGNGRLGHGSDWLRVATDGARTAVALPAAFRAFRIERDRIWGTIADTLGVESVAWVGLDSLR